jgi:phage repressor protein C with HTH and peptisase S24 domain
MRKFGFLGLSRVRVSGESMSPTYNHGDILLVKWLNGVSKELALTTVVVIVREEMPGILFIKRIQKSHSGAYWVEGDNEIASAEDRMNDSRRWGYVPAHEVRGRVLFRLKRSNERKLQQ